MFESMLEMLRCPACVSLSETDAGKLALIADAWFVCEDCGRKYPIRGGIPIMLVDEGDKNQNVPVEGLGEP